MIANYILDNNKSVIDREEVVTVLEQSGGDSLLTELTAENTTTVDHTPPVEQVCYF